MFQKYENISDVEAEFIPQLEKLMANKIPSFDFLIETQKDANEETIYYLLFGDRDNAPKGFIKGEIKKKKRVLLRPHKQINWCGLRENAFIIDPKFIKEFKNNFNKIKKVTAQDYRIKDQFIVAPKELEEDNNIVSQAEYIDTLFKSHQNYQDYLSSLNTNLQKQIKKSFSSFKDLTINQYSSIKECFSYKKDSTSDYKELKKTLPMKILESHSCAVMALESNNRVLGFSFLVFGQSNHSFFAFKNLSGLVDELLLIQMSIMLFYEFENSHYLHSLNSLESRALFIELGFSSSLETKYKV